VAQDAGGDEARDRLFVEAPRQVAADVEQVVETEHLGRELLVQPSQLAVDPAVLDTGGHARGHAAHEAALLGAVGLSSRERPEAEHGDRAVAATDGAEQRQAVAGPGLVPGPHGGEVFERRREAQRGRRAGGEAAGSAEREAAAIVPHEHGPSPHVELRHAQALLAAEVRAEGGGDLEERDELRQTAEQRGPAILPPQAVEDLLVVEGGSGSRHGAQGVMPASNGDGRPWPSPRCP
jgi:hypothetical protein